MSGVGVPQHVRRRQFDPGKATVFYNEPTDIRSQERPAAPRPTAEPVADVRAFTLGPRTFPTCFGGLFLFLPELVRLDAAGLAAAARLPGSRMLPAAHALRACLALKLWSVERKSDIMALVADEGLGLFAGLNVSPKKSFLGAYSDRVDHARTVRLLAAWHEHLDWGKWQQALAEYGLDPAFYAIREVAEIPYSTLTEASTLLACMLSPNFALLCHHRPLLLRVVENVKRYGLMDRFIECNAFPVPPADLHRGFDDAELILKPARVVAKEAKKKGVCMFVVAEGILNMIFAKHNIHEIEGIPILEGSSAVVKVAEMLVDMKKMGIADASRSGLYTPLPKPDLAYLRKLFGVG